MLVLVAILSLAIDFFISFCEKYFLGVSFVIYLDVYFRAFCFYGSLFYGQIWMLGILWKKPQQDGSARMKFLQFSVITSTSASMSSP